MSSPVGIVPSADGGGGMTLIAYAEFSNSIEWANFTGLPADTDYVMYIWADDEANSGNVYCHINGDTTAAHYNSVRCKARNAAVSSDGVGDSRIGYLSSATGFHLSAFITRQNGAGNYVTSQTANEYSNETFAQKWNQAGAITEIHIHTAAGDTRTGAVYLYSLNKV